MNQANNQEIKFLIKEFEKKHSSIHRILQYGIIGYVVATIICLLVLPKYINLVDKVILSYIIKGAGFLALALAIFTFLMAILSLLSDKGVFKAIEMTKKKDKKYGYLLLTPQEVIVFSNTEKPFNLPLKAVLSYELSLPNLKGLTRFNIHVLRELESVIPLTSGNGIEFSLEQEETEKLMDYVNTVQISHFDGFREV